MPNRLILAALLLLACGRRLRDEGAACLPTANRFFGDTADLVEIAADEPSEVTIVFDTCASGSVDWRRRRCEATVDGLTLTVSSSVIREAPLFAMTADCQFVTTTCPTPSLAAGAWSLVYGDAEAPFDVPYEGPPVCAGAE